MQYGILAGYPLVGEVTSSMVHTTMFDSSEMAFKIAGSQVVKEGARHNPVLLEPLMSVEVRTPEEYMGDASATSTPAVVRSPRCPTRCVKVIKAGVPLRLKCRLLIGDLRLQDQGRSLIDDLRQLLGGPEGSCRRDRSEVPRLSIRFGTKLGRDPMWKWSIAEPVSTPLRPAPQTANEGSCITCRARRGPEISIIIHAPSRLIEVRLANRADEKVFCKCF